jgi:anaerobic magnesium-protoporphyrin IX monomethyl ester cyclase
MKKILFITPPFHAGVVEVAGSWIPLYFVYLAGSVRAAGFNAEIYDAMSKQVGYEEIESKIIESRPYSEGFMPPLCMKSSSVSLMPLITL